VLMHGRAGAAGDGARGASLQDILRLLTLWFSHGAAPDVAAALEEGFGHVSIDTWLVVIPQVPCSNPIQVPLTLACTLAGAAMCHCHSASMARCAGIPSCAHILYKHTPE